MFPRQGLCFFSTTIDQDIHAANGYLHPPKIHDKSYHTYRTSRHALLFPCSGLLIYLIQSLLDPRRGSTRRSAPSDPNWTPFLPTMVCMVGAAQRPRICQWLLSTIRSVRWLRAHGPYLASARLAPRLRRNRASYTAPPCMLRQELRSITRLCHNMHGQGGEN
jgi:hypothetical protein